MSHKISIIIPSYNEGSGIESILVKLATVEMPYNYEKEIVVVDDGSTDDTADYAKNYIGSNPDQNIHFVRHKVNSGKGMAIRTALKHLTGDVVVIQDSDDELDPNDIAVMLKKMIDENLPVVYGSRFLKKDHAKSHYRSFYYGARLLSWLTNVLFAQHITDEPTCYKMFRSSLLCSLRLECRGFEFCPEVTAKVARMKGVKISEVPISYFPRTIDQGKKIRAKDGLKAIWYLLKYRFVK